MAEQVKTESGSKALDITDTAFVEFVAMKTAQLVSGEVVAREERRGKRTAIIFSILALIGFGGIAGVISLQIKSAVNDAIETEIPKLDPIIEQKARSLVDANIGEIRRTLQQNEDLEELIDLVRALQETEGSFPNSLRDSIIEKLRILGDVDRITSQQRFLVAMETVVKKFAAVPLPVHLDELDDLVGNSISNSTMVSLDMADHYGEQIIGSAYPVQEMEGAVQRLQKYLVTAEQEGYPEKSLMWELFIEFKRSKYMRNDVTDRLVESIQDLEDVDHDEFFKFVDRYSSWENWMRQESQEGRELERLAKALMTEYPAILDGVEQYRLTAEEDQT